MADEAANPTSDRFVIIGASNVSIGFPRIVEILRHGTPNRCEILAAMGHGRSYGGWSRFLFRELPGIVDCGLWNAMSLESKDFFRTSTRAIITDVGNDLLYGFGADQILEWVEICIGRLLQHAAEIILTLPPLAAIHNLTRWRFRLMRTLFFPRSRRTLDDLIASAERIADGLCSLAKESELPLVEPPANWYGFDPIHIRRRTRTEAWRKIVSNWRGFDAGGWNGRIDRRLNREFRRVRPAVRRYRGERQESSQPSVKADGLSVSLF